MFILFFRMLNLGCDLLSWTFRIEFSASQSRKVVRGKVRAYYEIKLNKQESLNHLFEYILSNPCRTQQRCLNWEKSKYFPKSLSTEESGGADFNVNVCQTALKSH